MTAGGRNGVEPLPKTRPGDAVLRRIKRSRGRVQAVIRDIARRIRRLFGAPKAE